MNALKHTVSGTGAVAIGTRALLIVSIMGLVAGCNTTTVRDVNVSVATDYRARHPITLKEGKRTLAVFVGSGRGGLSAMQRAEVLAFAQTWKREAIGGVTIDRPVGGPNERASQDTLREVLSIIEHAGVPSHGIGIRPYETHSSVATIRLSYPEVKAHAGPCGLWPDDLGPSYDLKHYENQHYYNFGCAQQRNLAAMVANPVDLVQPRAETPAYTAKRTFGVEKWRKGESPATTYTDPQKGAISDLGK
jgi:pilus assembly protein CpaD